MDTKTQTNNTYNKQADEFAAKFDALGARIDDIKETFLLIKKENPKVLEIGCGNGRDAEEIIKYTDDYVGMDVSENLLKIARIRVPQVKFENGDIENYQFPKNLDIVFAFASLIHVPKENLRIIFKKLMKSLNPKGVVRISLKHSDSYCEITNRDELGVRTYYYYSLEDIKNIVEECVFVKNEFHTLNGQTWLEILLLKE